MGKTNPEPTEKRRDMLWVESSTTGLRHERAWHLQWVRESEGNLDTSQATLVKLQLSSLY